VPPAHGADTAKEKITMRPLKRVSAWTRIVVLAGALSGCAAYEKCGFDGCPGDAKLTANVQAAFAQHRDLGPPNSINVRTLNHVVYLSGEVSDGNMRENAESVAHAVKGVTGVENNIAVSH
jgi:osmotically-inducible protein OsmY